MDMTMILTKNAAQCRLCLDRIKSISRHDFKSCSCGEISVDGGVDYTRRLARNFDNFIELSEYRLEEIEQRELSCFWDLLWAAQYALDNLPNIATSEIIGSVVYQETRMKLLLAIEKFEKNTI